MGLMAELMTVAKSTVRRWKSSPGDVPVVSGTGVGGAAIEVELYGIPGIAAIPGRGSRVIHIPVGGSKYRVGIAAHNYASGIAPSEGEITIYSTDESGQTVKSTIALDDAGNIDLNGNGKRLTTHAELNTALQSMVASFNAAFAAKLDGGGTAGAVTLNISAAETQTVRTGG